MSVRNTVHRGWSVGLTITPSTDRSGSIDGHELANALRSFGYNLTPQILMLLEQKYGSFRVSFRLLVRADRLLRGTYSETRLGGLRTSAWDYL